MLGVSFFINYSTSLVYIMFLNYSYVWILFLSIMEEKVLTTGLPSWSITMHYGGRLKVYELFSLHCDKVCPKSVINNNLNVKNWNALR